MSECLLPYRQAERINEQRLDGLPPAVRHEQRPAHDIGAGESGWAIILPIMAVRQVIERETQSETPLCDKQVFSVTAGPAPFDSAGVGRDGSQRQALVPRSAQREWQVTRKAALTPLLVGSVSWSEAADSLYRTPANGPCWLRP